MQKARFAPLIAKHLREVWRGENWTVSNLKDHLEDITWQEATTCLGAANSILTLAWHVNYYIGVAAQVLKGGPVTGDDKLSFDHPAVSSQQEWEGLLSKFQADAEEFATLIEAMPDAKLTEYFSEEKYGNWYRNLHGIIEHAHYHLGQIVLLKKLIREKSIRL
jgi:uncharacterized damage-inducible protein DinB